MKHYRRVWLFVRIVWRVWEEPMPGYPPFRINPRLAWQVVCIVHP